MLTVYLSKSAQKAAYLANLPASRELQFSVPADLIDRFFRLGGEIDSQGQPDLAARCYSTDRGQFGAVGDLVDLSGPCATASEAIAELEQIKKSRDEQAAAKQAEEDAKQREIDRVARQWLEEWPISRLMDWLTEHGDLHGVPDADLYGVDADLREHMRSRRVEAVLHFYRGLDLPLDLLIEAHAIESDYEIYTKSTRSHLRYQNYSIDRAVLYRAQPDLSERVNAEVERKNQAHIAELRQWIVDHYADDPTAVERFDARLLGSTEIRNRLRTVIFADLDDIPRYQRIVDSDLDHDPDHCYAGASVKYNVDDIIDSCTADEWRRYQAIMAAAPDDTTMELREHKASCLCGAKIVRNSCMVTLKKFGFRLSREYALSD